jgi:hypothetical protein
MASPIIQIDALSGSMLRAAMHVADGRMTNDEIAADVGVSRSTLAKWKLRESFRTEVERIRATLRDQVLLEGITLKANRIRTLNDLYKRIEQIIAERAADPAMQNIPGGTTGLMKRTIKSIGSGANAAIIVEGTFDIALCKESRAILAQMAKEMDGEES